MLAHPTRINRPILVRRWGIKLRQPSGSIGDTRMRVVVNPYMGTSLTRLSGFMLSFRRPISFADQFGQLDKSDRRECQPRNGEDAFSKTLMRSTRNPATSPSSVPARCAAGSVVLR